RRDSAADWPHHLSARPAAAEAFWNGCEIPLSYSSFKVYFNVSQLYFCKINDRTSKVPCTCNLFTTAEHREESRRRVGDLGRASVLEEPRNDVGQRSAMLLQHHRRVVARGERCERLDMRRFNRRVPLVAQCERCGGLHKVCMGLLERLER